MTAAKKIEDIVIYKDERYYSAFPSVCTLDKGRVLVALRRAPDPRYFAGYAEEVKGWASHVHPNSHIALIELDRHLRPVGELRMITHNPDGGDQDGNTFVTSDGRVLVASFSWHPIPPDLYEKIKGKIKSFHISFGSCFFLAGTFFISSLDGGESWSERTYLPEIPDGEPVVAGKIPLRGGALRGRPVELGDGKILAATYTSLRKDLKSWAYLYSSSDRGINWKYERVIAKDGDNKVDMHEPGLFLTESGRIICFIRTTNIDDRLVTAESADGGKTWSDWKARDVMGHPYDAVRLRDGRVFLIYGYRHDPYGIRVRVLDPECGDIDSAEETVIRNDGLSGDLGYPSATLLPDGKVLATYYIYGEDGIRHIAGSVLEVV